MDATRTARVGARPVEVGLVQPGDETALGACDSCLPANALSNCNDPMVVKSIISCNCIVNTPEIPAWSHPPNY